MNNKNLSLGKILLLSFIIISFTSSIIFSLDSFTGYVISETVSESKNLYSVGLFLFGLFGAIFYLTKLR